MRNISVFLGFFFFCVFAVFAQEELRRNPQYINYLSKFNKLRDSEILSYEYGEFISGGKRCTFKVYARNTENGQERIIGYWDTPYRCYQFSEMRRKMVFGIRNQGRFNPFFLIDGDAGNIIYLFDVDSSGMTSKDLGYLLYYDGPGDEIHGEPFVLIDLAESKVIKKLYWKIAPLIGGWQMILRSSNPAYDFRIDYGVEANLYATCYYNIVADKLDVALDDTRLPYARELEREKVTLEEMGL
jgi:hypothetical protein